MTRWSNRRGLLPRGGLQEDDDGPALRASPNSFNRPVLPTRRGRGRVAVDTVSNSSALQLNRDVRKYIEEQDQIGLSSDSETWLQLPELPTEAEISIDEDIQIELPSNKIRGSWRNPQKYLRSHHALLREDAVSPLREAVTRFRSDPDMKDDQKISIYEKVYVLGFTFAQLGIAAKVRFSTARAGKRIPWQSSRRLTSGSIVALTDATAPGKQFIIAIVAARPLQHIDRAIPEVFLYFTRTDDIPVDPQQEWIMIEARQGYFEAHRHTLRALQKMSQERFPLSQHICSLFSNIEPPSYVSNNPTVDLSPAMTITDSSMVTKSDVLHNWPNAPQGTLDQSQWEAMHHVLTKSFAIIQGPPGCGKTYVSKIALNIIASQFDEDDPPIVVAAQTNHALDQLLNHVSVFEPNYIRLGGRSTNYNVKQRALYEVRQKEPIPKIHGSIQDKAYKNWHFLSKSLKQILEPLDQDESDCFTIETLLDHGIITEQQHKSLQVGASQWVSTEETNIDPLQLWLDRALIPFKIDYTPLEFDVEEAEDLAFENIDESNAEHGVQDEEDAELLRGEECSLKVNFMVCKQSASEFEYARKLLHASQDLQKIPKGHRAAVYDFMQQSLKDTVTARFREAAKAYENVMKNLKIGKWERDAVYLQRAKIIGMTTTGLSKYRPLIASLKSKIILIEEAAEVIEAPITVACMDTLEHLILVGDHQQLQGHCSVPELEAKPFYLNVSLFERMVHNQMPYKTLLRQRRMNPEFRELISPLYPRLQDHQDVVNRVTPAWGMGSLHSFFFHHESYEDKDDQMSTFNMEEAKFVAGSYRYLIRNRVSPQSITILTFYNGQRKRILKEIRAFSELATFNHNVKTVDSYQGEENDIILLSLVRNNTRGMIGFLDISNRVCVAMARARLGFYMFDNANLLAEKSSLWQHVVALMSRGRLGTRFPLTCQKHRRTISIQIADEWDNNDGGCDQVCGDVLCCGHLCPLKCHVFPHELAECLTECNKTLNCGHKCGKNCTESCHCNCPEFDQTETLSLLSKAANSCNLTLRPANSNNSCEPRASSITHDRHKHATRRLQSQNSSVTASPTKILANRSSASPQNIIAGSEQWRHYAGGGVKRDDEERSRSDTTCSDRMAMPESSNPGLLIDLLDPVESSNNIAENVSVTRGRTRYVETYSLEHMQRQSSQHDIPRKKKVLCSTVLWQPTRLEVSGCLWVAGIRLYSVCYVSFCSSLSLKFMLLL